MMEQGGITQTSGASKQSTRTKASARGELREMMSAIGRTAKSLAVDDDRIEELFRTSQTKNEQQLLSTARSFYTNAQPLEAKFVRYELPPISSPNCRPPSTITNKQFQHKEAHKMKVSAQPLCKTGEWNAE